VTDVSAQEHVLSGDTRFADRLWVAVRRFDDQLAYAVLNRALALLPPGEVADRVVVPVLRRLGETWHLSARTIAVEHFTCQVVRARFRAHAAGTSPTGSLTLCFTPSGDQHDLGVHLAASALADAGWQTRMLGADTPQASVEALLDELQPRLMVVGACLRPAAEAFLARDVTRRCPLLAGGAGFSSEDAGAGAAVVVHHGGFAAVPAIARSLLEREAAGGRG
jgi:MerR family transcriptional regulator, light-induced transcriptional regulator